MTSHMTGNMTQTSAMDGKSTGPIMIDNGSSLFTIENDANTKPPSVQDQSIHSDSELTLVASSLTESSPYTWNTPRINIGRLIFSFLSLLVAGMGDSVVGALIPSIESHYKLDYTTVSLIFLTPFSGYSIAAFTCSRIHMKWGQRGVAILAPTCHLITSVILACHPPFPLLIIGNAFSGFGTGLADSCFPAWVGGMSNASAIQGLLTACYSLGALFAPLVATALISSAHLPWYSFYYIMIVLSFLELSGLVVFFWRCDGDAYRSTLEQNATDESTSPSGVRAALKSKIAWIIALFFFFDTAGMTCIGGWTVTFMLRVRDASLSASGISASGYWLGMALGRAVLGIVNEKFGIRICTLIYLIICIGLELSLWLIPNFAVSAVSVFLLGFFLGPMYPGGVMIATKLLPKSLHVSAIGFTLALGGVGGTIFTFLVGAIASKTGVWVLQPIVLGLIVLETVCWLSLPGFKRKIRKTMWPSNAINPKLYQEA